MVEYLPRAVETPRDAEAREAFGLATDLGGYAIMHGGTIGAYPTSFSLVDILSHGRACAIMNPYYTILFTPAVEDALKLVACLASCQIRKPRADQKRKLKSGIEAMVEIFKVDRPSP